MGSVFSPYYAWARARSPLTEPENFCAINVAIYAPRKKLWTMTERGRAALRRDETHYVLGPSHLTWTGNALRLEIDERTMPLPGRVRGHIELTPNAMTGQPFALDAAGRHMWWPLAPSAHVKVSLEGPEWRWEGPGYLDRNWGSEPLEAAFASWAWSRTHFGKKSVLFYDAQPRTGQPRSLALCVDADGAVSHIAPPGATPLPRTAWRLDRVSRSETPARLVRSLEDTPFYARASVESRWQGERAIGMHEYLSLDRFSSRVVQAMLPFRMPRRGG